MSSNREQQRIEAGFSIDAQRLADIARIEQNFTPALYEAIRVSDDCLEAISEAWPRYSHLDFLDPYHWLLMGDTVTPDVAKVFAYLGLAVEPILTVEWDGGGPRTSTVNYRAVRDLCGCDIIYRWDEVVGYPIVATQPAGMESIDTMVRRAMHEEFMGGELQSLPTRIINPDEHVLPPLWFRQTIFDALDRHEQHPDSYGMSTGWTDLRRSIVDDLLYPDQPRSPMILLREVVLGPIREDEFDVDDDESDEISEEEKWTLVDTYLNKAYWTAEAFQRHLDAIWRPSYANDDDEWNDA